jgi:hypothetical protein
MIAEDNGRADLRTPDLPTSEDLAGVTRRDFLKVFGAGITVFFTIDGLLAFQEPGRLPQGRGGYPTDFNAYLKGSQVLETGFETYEVPHFSWLPKIETIIIDAKELPASGGGEPPIVGMGAVLANAIFDATGARLYRLPMTPARVLAGMKKTT